VRITQDQIATLRLIKRSPPNEAGWAPCALAIYKLIVKLMPKELVETTVHQDSGQAFVRLTQEAEIVLKWVG
jgi:hypothetical protein